MYWRGRLSDSTPDADRKPEGTADVDTPTTSHPASSSSAGRGTARPTCHGSCAPGDICTWFPKGVCKRGEGCQYCHSCTSEARRRTDKAEVWRAGHEQYKRAADATNAANQKRSMQFAQDHGCTVMIHYETLYKGVPHSFRSDGTCEFDTRGPCGCHLTPQLCQFVEDQYKANFVRACRRCKTEADERFALLEQPFSDRNQNFTGKKLRLHQCYMRKNFLSIF